MSFLDEQLFSPSSNAEAKKTFGEQIQDVLPDYNYYGTRLPRLPILVEKEAKKKLAIVEKKRERAKFNKENFNLFTPSAECYCLSQKDYLWHYGKIISADSSMQWVRVSLLSDGSVFSDSLEGSEKKIELTDPKEIEENLDI
eukprot:TRINITY_DN9633_c0_g1_i1.p1 TRINITY_DN9633_c0_g1~~TRINITY_DN9633_c0_g1_i1.p1  ORF type:complete len:142 (-),score=25.98 TRINITY_DN9633_c0_g1_i1:158-583(-)